jgi:hypothetical protein
VRLKTALTAQRLEIASLHDAAKRLMNLILLSVVQFGTWPSDVPVIGNHSIAAPAARLNCAAIIMCRYLFIQLSQFDTR